MTNNLEVSRDLFMIYIDNDSNCQKLNRLHNLVDKFGSEIFKNEKFRNMVKVILSKCVNEKTRVGEEVYKNLLKKLEDGKSKKLSSTKSKKLSSTKSKKLSSTKSKKLSSTKSKKLSSTKSKIRCKKEKKKLSKINNQAFYISELMKQKKLDKIKTKKVVGKIKKISQL
jgi:hypothetical protein